MNLQRASGILLHPTSLPNGVLDEHAYRFVDWLAAAGQRWWQVLPLGPPEGRTQSPYMSPSAFAGSPELVANRRARVSRADAEEFRARNAYWIDDWVAWAGANGGGDLRDQVRFEREWRALRDYAGHRGVRLFGDIPIYVAHGGADHYAHPELFRKGVVAGVPPDAFSRTGQLWGNPLYDWRAMRVDGYRWWIERLRRTFALVDLTRIDHFRGFVAYWAVPAGNRTATRGRWLRGPGARLFDAVRIALGSLPVVAEDLGLITEPVVRLRRELGLPGMVVLQFALGGDPSNPHLPANHEEQSVVYTGTHDNDTTVGWWNSLSRAERESTGLDPSDPAWSLIEVAWSSRAALAVAPLQDVLRLGSEARMNLPGTDEGNWRWRFEPRDLTDELARDLRRLTEGQGRAGAAGRSGSDPGLTPRLRVRSAGCGAELASQLGSRRRGV
ncbi:MAG TPA: 4-alpha-glucanotransferase [Gaiellaceae bacterium]|nr:4-alpha-glucanotransferase [Gaiellaceae bacterium]